VSGVQRNVIATITRTMIAPAREIRRGAILKPLLDVA
jgi:hypothetical protein